MWKRVGNTLESSLEPTQNALYWGDTIALADSLLDEYRGKVQMVYIDPPFYTGDIFTLKQRVGEQGWKTGKACVTLPAFIDRFPGREEYISFLRGLLELAKELLTPSGTVFVHVDGRMNAPVRMLLDQIFGEKQFLNEIIWVYQTGGRATKYFSRKHDTVFFYAKSPDYAFDISCVPINRQENRNNHMRKRTDDDGRTYRTITVGGKTYTYYDDTPAYPSDVWTDVSHLQQKDPQRTGYDTQKPQRLLERMILPTTKPGDIVCDLCCGSGTTLATAKRLKRRYIGVDKSIGAIATTRRRIWDESCRFIVSSCRYQASLEAEILPTVGILGIQLKSFSLPGQQIGVSRFTPAGFVPKGLDLVDQVALGVLRGDTFFPLSVFSRSQKEPTIPEVLEAPLYSGDIAILIIDIFGGKHVFRYEE